MTLVGKALAALLTVACAALLLSVQQFRLNAAEHRADAAEQEAKQLQVDLNDARENPVVITQYVDRVREVRVKGDTIIQKVPLYVTAQADAACIVPVGFVRLHDAAATNTAPDDPSDSDARPSGVALSTVAATVADKYTSYHELAARFDALRDKLRRSPYVRIEEESVTP
ncbi:hypothetical protein [Pandoraea sputorum]|uniref:Uncharacterized protein n=1 Tax=Pandoraea sputorum TaxID=93222 RepID=A0A239SVK2_9BURK|nr:hypothetical protein [Pandoraea sputorum]AJC15140.1 hypothetical protein NA29_02125 [Pandoraea sputorum]SNU89535.1 Uncharacterised protein [Pandoraea sputorum]